VPKHAQSLNDCLQLALSKESANAFLSDFRTNAMTGNTGLTLPIPAAGFNVEPKSRAWVDRRCSPQALATFETQVLLTGRGSAVKDRLVILAEGWDPSAFPYYAKHVTGKAGWRVSKVPCGHYMMADMPIELANLLMTLT